MKAFIRLFSGITISLFLLLAFTINSFAQQKNLRQSSNEISELPMQYLSAAEGLSQGMINDIIIDQLGYLYVATKEGLNRFDGVSFKVYRHSLKDPNSLADNYVTSLFVDENNFIWTGTYNNGLDYFDPSTETFTHFNLNELNVKGPGLHNIISIQSAGNGRIIVLIGNELKVIEKNTTKKGFLIKEIEELYPKFKDIFQDSFQNKRIICQRDGTTWIKHGANVFRYSSKGLEPISTDRPLQNNHLSTEVLWENPYTKQICLISENRILQFDNATNKFLTWLVLPPPYTFTKLVFTDYEGGIWSRYNNKYFLRINTKTASFELIELSATSLNGNPIMMTAKVDNQGNIWLGSNGWGLFKISPTSIYLKKAKNYHRKKYQFAWPFRTSKNGLNAVYDPIKISDWIDKIEHTDLYEKGFRSDVHKEYFAVDGEGNYWFEMLNIKNNTATVIKMSCHSGKYEIVKEKKVISTSDKEFRGFQPIFSDRKNRIWVAEYTRKDTVKIYLFEHGGSATKEFILPFLQKSPAEQRIISDWVEDQDGIIWLATTMGLFALSPETGQWKVYQEGREKGKSLSLDKLLSVCLDPNQPQKYIWIGTEGGGLNRLDKSTNSITIYTIENGLPNNVIYSI